MVRTVEDVAVRLETIGYMVYRRIADLDMVDELIGGVIVFWWDRIKPFAERDRARQSSQKAYEWVQWLAERLAERGPRNQKDAAYITRKAWRP
jgi:hypothetical protein